MEKAARKSPEILRSYPALGGHMQYERIIIERQDGSTFAKIHNADAFTDPARRQHSQHYLHKEHHIYKHIGNLGYKHIPNDVAMHNSSTLVMDALLEDEGWHWKAPQDQYHHYVTDTLHALSELQALPIPETFHDTLAPTLDTFASEGWNLIDEKSRRELINKLPSWQQEMQPGFYDSALQLIENLNPLKHRFSEAEEPRELFLCHHDFRQANFAWHPSHGTKIVDWSWAGLGRKHSDETSLFIDLYKSGFNVDQYKNMINYDHLLSLTGFWLAHSLWPTKDNASNVRFHQFTSAVAAYRLLSK